MSIDDEYVTIFAPINICVIPSCLLGYRIHVNEHSSAYSRIFGVVFI